MLRKQPAESGFGNSPFHRDDASTSGAHVAARGGSGGAPVATEDVGELEQEAPVDDIDEEREAGRKGKRKRVRSKDFNARRRAANLQKAVHKLAVEYDIPEEDIMSLTEVMFSISLLSCWSEAYRFICSLAGDVAIVTKSSPRARTSKSNCIPDVKLAKHATIVHRHHSVLQPIALALALTLNLFLPLVRNLAATPSLPLSEQKIQLQTQNLPLLLQSVNESFSLQLRQHRYPLPLHPTPTTPVTALFLNFLPRLNQRFVIRIGTYILTKRNLGLLD